MAWYLHEWLVTDQRRLAAGNHAIVQDGTANLMKLQEQKDGCRFALPLVGRPWT